MDWLGSNDKDWQLLVPELAFFPPGAKSCICWSALKSPLVTEDCKVTIQPGTEAELHFVFLVVQLLSLLFLTSLAVIPFMLLLPSLPFRFSPMAKSFECQLQLIYRLVCVCFCPWIHFGICDQNRSCIYLHWWKNITPRKGWRDKMTRMLFY